MPLARRTNPPEIWLPLNAGPVSFTPGVATMSAWNALATPANDFYLTHLLASHIHTGSAAGIDAAEFAYGAGYTPIDVVRRTHAFSDATNDAGGWYGFSQETRPGKVPAGQQISVRGQVGAAPNAMECMAVGFDGAYPAFASLPSDAVAGAGRFYPGNTGYSTINTGAAPAWSTPQTIIDPAPNDMLVTYLAAGAAIGDFIASWTAYQLGVGPAGSETWLATSIIAHAQSDGWIWPPVWVLAGERLAIRAMAVSTGSRRAAIKVHDL